MSENIQSISQGTFTIGQTSATNFIAGPGISIDSPSAGTVRIGNDETVLAYGTYSTGVSLSESPMNFEKIKVITRVGGNDTAPYNNFGAGSVSEFYTHENFTNACITGMFAGTSANNTNDIYLFITKWNNANTTDWTRTTYGFKSLTASGGFSTNGSWYNPMIIIGINRISGNA